MTRTAARAHFTSAALIRRLAEHRLIDAAAPRPELAGRLAQWLSFADALALYAAHGEHSDTTTADADASGYDALEDCALTRQALAASITDSLTPQHRRSRLRLPEAPAEMSDAALAYEPFRRFHLAHQREMQQALSALRRRLRSVALRQPACAELARLDAVFDSAVAERETRLLATIPPLLKSSFAASMAQHPASPADGLIAYCRDLEAMLHAELDLRLQPALGLAEALHVKCAGSAPVDFGRSPPTSLPVPKRGLGVGGHKSTADFHDPRSLG